MNILELAFLGDALYEVFVRTHIINNSPSGRADILHRRCVRYVCAGGQSDALIKMMESGYLSDAEAAFARRAHNHKTATKPKNADPVTYKWATAFEALLGYLELSGNKERLHDVMAKAVYLTEERQRADNAEKR